MDIQKPAPLQVGDRYYYTLTSYDPVSITVKIPFVTEQSIEWALRSVCERAGLEKDAEPTDAWVAEHVEGAESLAGLREAVHSQLEEMNSRYAEESKPALCAEQLAMRLCQSVPEDQLAQVRAMVAQGLEADARQQGAASFAALVAKTGMPTSQIDRMIDEEAQATAEQEAALDAYASEKKYKVADEELPALLHLSPADADQLIHEAKDHGQMDMVRQAALREKASRSLATECSCTYEHETEADAKARLEQYGKVEEVANSIKDTAEKDDSPDASKTDGEDFKLV